MRQYNTCKSFYHGGEFPLTSLIFILSKYLLNQTSVHFFFIIIVQVSIVKDPDNIGKTWSCLTRTYINRDTDVYGFHIQLVINTIT